MRHIKVNQSVQKDSKLKSCFDKFQFKQFYFNQMVTLIHPINLAKNISVLIVIISSLTILSFALKNDSINQLQQLRTTSRVYDISNFIQYLQILPLIKDQFAPQLYYKISFFAVSLALNSFFILCLALAYALRNYNLIKYFEIIFQIFTTIYNKWPIYVFLNVSLNIIQENSDEQQLATILLSYLNIILTLAIEMYVFKGYDIILACIVTVPLSIQIIKNYKEMQNLSLFHEFSNASDLLQYKDSKFLKMIRMLLDQAKLSQNSYLLKGQGINYEIIIKIHENQCAKNKKYCFCHHFKRFEKNDSLQIQELSEQHFRQEFAQLVILQLLEDYIQNSQTNSQSLKYFQLKLSYLNYLYEIINNPTRVLVQLQKIAISQQNKTNKTNLFDQFYFEQVKLQILKDYQVKLFDSNIENQKMNMMEIILFDDKINIYKEKLGSVLFRIGHFYDFLNGNKISLQQLEKMSHPLINLNQNLEQSIVELFQINPTNFDLLYLTSIYIQLIDFQNRRIKEFQSAAFHLQKQKNLKQIKLGEVGQFSENSCALFISLTEKEFLIKKVSNKFDKIFGYSHEFIQGKELNTLIPNLIKRQHNQIVQSFIDESSVDIISQGIYYFFLNRWRERSLFGLDRKNFIFPISLRMKIQVFENDLGVCAHIKKNKQRVCALVQKNKQIFSYIFFENQGIITDYSKKIYQEVFQSLGLKRCKILQILQTLNIFELIPSLQEIMKTQQFNKHFSSVLVVKEQYITLNTNNQNYTSLPTYINNLYTPNDEVFLIQFKLFSHKTKNKIDINYIEIDFFQKELNSLKKLMVLDQLNKQKIQRESLIFIKQESQQTLEYANSLQQQFFSTREFTNFFSTREFTNVFENSDLNKYQEDIKNYQNNFYKQQTLEKSNNNNNIQQSLNQNDLSKFQFQNNKNSYHKHLNDQKMIKTNENTNIYQRNYEFKQVYQNGNYDKQNQELSTSLINSPNKMLTNTVEYTEMILSPVFSHKENQPFLINQSNEYQNFKLHPQHFQQNSNNLQEISFNNNSSYQYLNKQPSANNIQPDQHKILKQNSLFNNNFQQIKYDSQELSPIKRESQSFNFREKEDLKQDQKNEIASHELKNEIASVNSSKYSTEEIMKKKMIQKIKKTEFTKGLHLMAISGVLAFIILSIVSLIIYFQNLNSLSSLNSFVQSFLKIDDAQYCFIDVMNLVGLNNYQSVLGYNQYLIIDSLDLQNYEYNQTDFQEQGVLQDYNINLQKLVLDNDSSDQLFELQKNMFQVQIYAAGFYNNARVQQNSTTTFEQSLQYTLMEFFYEITFYYINYEEQQEDFIWGNIYNFKQRMKNLQLIVENYAKDQFNNMNLYQIFAIILFATISAVLIFSIVPLNIMIQIQKEKILKLFGTFSPAAIELQIKQIELSLYKMEQISIKEQTKSFTIAKRSDDFTGLNNKQNNFQKQLTFQKVQNYQYLNNLQGNNSLNLNQNDFINKIKSKDWPQKVRTGNRKKYWREKEEHKEEQYNEIASVNSSKYSTEEIMKRKMIKKIKKMELTSRLKLMVFTGVAAFLILSFVSSIIYIQNTNSLNSFVRSFLKVDDGIFCFIDIMNFISLKKYEVILQQNQSLIIDNLDLQKYEQNLAYHQQNEVLQDYKSNLQKLVLVNYNKDQLYQLQNNLFQVHIYGAKTENYNQDQQDSITTYELSLQYTLMELLQQITFYYLNQGDSQEDFIWGNIYSFKQRMKDLQLIVQDNAKRQFNNMDTQNNCSSIALNNASYQYNYI
ncbi:hypothetical protein ABPG73_020872 [Tetrahymena malaccensis]